MSARPKSNSRTDLLLRNEHVLDAENPVIQNLHIGTPSSSPFPSENGELMAVSTRPSIQRLQSGLMTAQLGADGKGGLESDDPSASEAKALIKAFDSFLWLFWLGLTIPLINILIVNRNNFPPGNEHRYSVSI